MKNLYEMIYKRRSMRKFDDGLHLTQEELDAINARVSSLTPLSPDVKIAFKIVPRSETTAKWGEYCILVYSEKVTGYLENIGYMVEELDLYFASIDVGACWYGLARTSKDEHELDGLPYSIMVAFGKSRPEDFRSDPAEFDRKPLSEMWRGATALDAAEAARLSPSACNSQPWYVECGEGGELMLYKKYGENGLVGRMLGKYYNPMDMGIYMRILEISLEHFGYAFDRELIFGDVAKKLALTAKYTLKRIGE